VSRIKNRSRAICVVENIKLKATLDLVIALEKAANGCGFRTPLRHGLRTWSV